MPRHFTGPEWLFAAVSWSSSRTESASTTFDAGCLEISPGLGQDISLIGRPRAFGVRHRDDACPYQRVEMMFLEVTTIDDAERIHNFRQTARRIA